MEYLCKTEAYFPVVLSFFTFLSFPLYNQNGTFLLRYRGHFHCFSTVGVWGTPTIHYPLPLYTQSHEQV